MKLEQQEEVFINVYSIDYLLKCSVAEIAGKSIKICPASGKTDMFQICDPVVIISYHANQIEMFPADVISIDSKSCSIELNISNIDVDQERRIFERYPASLEISARRKYSNKRLHMLVKNISLYGMGAISSTELEVEDLIDIDLITEKNMFYFSGKVMWRKKLNDDYFEYGIQLTDYDVTTLYQYQGYLNKQTSYFISLIPKAR